MRTKVSRDFVIIIILIPLFMAGAFYISSRMDGKLPAYSVINKSGTGLSVFFEAMKELHLPVKRTLEPIGSRDIEDIQVAASGSGFDVNSEEVRTWVKSGGILVYLDPGNFHNIEYGTVPEIRDNMTVYQYNKGKIIASNVNNLTNKALTTKTGDAYNLLKEIGSYSYKSIYFNEAHMFSTEIEKTIWDYVPLELKFIIYQFILVLVAFFYHKSKRFGKALPLYEEVERTENEYLYSAAALYKAARCWDIMLENYYKGFLKEMNSTHEDWIGYWERERLPQINKAKEVFGFMHNIPHKVKSKEYIKIVTGIEQLGNIIKKRRESYWKTLKRTR